MSAPAPIRPPFRSRKVLGHARGQLCTLRFPDVCNRNPETTVSCHIRDRHKGMARKSSDSSICFGCSSCHAYLDQGLWIGRIDEVDVLRIIIRAMQETLEILIGDEIVKWPHDKPRTYHEKSTPTRKPPAERAKIPSGRKLQSRNNLRRNP